MTRFRKFFLRWIVGLPIAVLAIIFAIANRQFVTLSFDPLTPLDPFMSVDMPLWLLFFVGILCGVVMGWIGSWISQGKWRKKAKEQELEISRLTAERDGLLQAESPAEKNLVPMSTSGWI